MSDNNTASATSKAALVLEALANGAVVALGGRKIVLAETETGDSVLACQVKVTKGGSDRQVTDFLALPDLPVAVLFQWAADLTDADVAALKAEVA